MDRDQARHVHRAVHLVPAVVVRHHAHDRVGDLGLARELGLGIEVMWITS